MKSIGVYIPAWLMRSDPSARTFARELMTAIENGGYRAHPLPLNTIVFRSPEEVDVYTKHHDIVLVINHDSACFSKDKTYRTASAQLEKRLRFLNPSSAHEITQDKAETKRLLRTAGLPVLDDVLLSTPEELGQSMEDDKWYVAKPPDRGSGTGVKLIRKQGSRVFEYRGGNWHPLLVIQKGTALALKPSFDLWLPFLILSIGVGGFLAYIVPFLALIGLLIPMLALYAYTVTDHGYTYRPLMLEPYFNDDDAGFSSLRCTVIGDTVVEAVERRNHKDITSNVSKGGSAVSIELTPQQKDIAVRATTLLGATFAGVDMLVRGDECVIGEINVGPITTYGSYTGVNVGKLLGEYVVRTS